MFKFLAKALELVTTSLGFKMIILLNGSINSGKTTVARAIVERAINFAHIEVDSLRDFIRWMPLEETIELNIKNAIDVAKNFHDNNINSVISYPLSEDSYLYTRYHSRCKIQQAVR
tara:strand:- start:21407 stop:21754 length:348 start_codon:yes stop_codon:yes gene_type:complete